MAEDNTNYKKQANVKVEFKTSGNPEYPWYNLLGFLSAEGLALRLKNNFNNTLDLAGSIFGMINEFITGAKTLATETSTLLNKLAITGNTVDMVGTNYVSVGKNGQNIILNAPYYWHGTTPIEFDLSLYQIADAETDIMEGYQRVLEIMSPSFGENVDLKGANENETITGTRAIAYGQGPGIVYVHYFPTNSANEPDTSGRGLIVFGPCLCTNVSMEITSPYSHKHMPIIGSYRLSLQTARILDRRKIKNLFQGSNGPLFPQPPREAITSIPFARGLE